MKISIIIIVAVVVLIALYIVSAYNSLVKLRISADSELTRALGSINAVAERYPELKANQNFLDLNEQLKKNEEDIANARKYYNAVVKKYNNKTQLFPSSIVASMFKFEKKQMFNIEKPEEKEAVKVEF